MEVKFGKGNRAVLETLSLMEVTMSWVYKIKLENIAFSCIYAIDEGGIAKMDDFMSSDEVLCYKDAVAFLKFSGRNPNSANVYRTIRRFVEDQVGLYRKKVSKFLLCVQLFFCIYIFAMSKK